jgi:hypothetical protein
MAVSISNSSILGKKMLSVEGDATYQGKKGTIRRGGDVYIVKMMTDDPTPVAALDAYPKDVEAVLKAQGLIIGYQSPDHSDLFITAISCSEVGPGIWESKVTYSSPSEEKEGEDKSDPGGGGGDPEKPWTQPPTVQWGTETATVARLYDGSGLPLKNSAGTTFQGGAEFPIVIPTATLTYTKLWDGRLNPTAMQRAYVGHVNGDVWSGWQPGEALIRALDVQLSYKNSIPLMEMSVTIAMKRYKVPNARKVKEVDKAIIAMMRGGGKRPEYSPELIVGWHKVLVDQGPYYVDKVISDPGVPGQMEATMEEAIVPFTDANGNPFVGLLDGRGGKHPVYTTKGAAIATSLPFFLVYDEFPSVNFAGAVPAIG